MILRHRHCDTETHDIGCSGDADRLNESEKQDESTAEPANDSLAAGDITADSVKIHITYVTVSCVLSHAHIYTGVVIIEFKDIL